MSEPRSTSSRKLLFGLGGAGLVGVVACLCLVTALLVGGSLILNIRQASTTQPAVAYILDTSPRMELPAEGSESQTRLEIAEAVLAEAIRPAEPAITSGLRVFGSGSNSEACRDTDLVVPFAPSNQSQIMSKLLALSAGSAADAALGEAMIAAIRDLSKYEGPHWLVVVTGGADSCNPDAGQLVAEEARRAGIDLKTFVIGYQVSDTDAQAIKGMVDDSGGSFLAAPNADSLASILHAIQAYINAPSNLLLTAISQAATPVASVAAVTPVLTATPGPTATPRPTPTPHVAQTACDHPYFPLRPGAWQYQAEGSKIWSVAAVTGDLTNATVTLNVKDYRKWMPDEITYTCSTEQGILIQSYQRRVYRSGQGEDFYYSVPLDYTVADQDGSVIPPPESFVTGATWSHAYTLQDANGQDDSTYTSDCQVTGAETLTVGSQVYDTLRADCSEREEVFERDATVSFWGPIKWLGRTATITRVSWYAYGIGLVRFDVKSECAYTDGADCSVNYSGEIEAAAFLDSPPEGYVLNDACGLNLYFPLIGGSSWNYSEGKSSSLYFTSGDLLLATANVNTSSGNEQEAIDYECTPDGIKLGYSVRKYVQAQDSSGNSLGPTWLNLTVGEQSGLYLPAADQLVPGAAWTHTYKLESGFPAENHSQVSSNCSAISTESITVPGGTFEALRVECTDTEEVFERLDTTSGAVIQGSQSTIKRTLWLAWGVGLVRLDFASQCTLSTGGDCSVSYTSELFSNVIADGGGGGGDGSGPSETDPDEAYGGGFRIP